MAKFKALVSFSNMNNMYEPSAVEPYNHDDNELVRAWENAGYVEVLADAEVKAPVEEKAEVAPVEAPKEEVAAEAPVEEKKTEEQTQGVE